MIEFLTTVFETALGIALGVLVSVCTLLFFHKILSAKICFSKDIRHIFSKEFQRPHYSIKIKKKGFFDLIDTKVTARIAVQGLKYPESTFWYYYVLPTTFSDSLSITNLERAIRLIVPKVEELKHDSSSILKTNLKVGRPWLGIRLEDVFMSYPNVYIQVFVMGHDELTGVKKLFLSPQYRFHNIRDGKWEGNKLAVNYSSKYA